jgi:deoxycytidylate deaminase
LTRINRTCTGKKCGKTVEQADFFVRNDSDRQDEVDRSIRRFIDLILGVGVVTPTRQERGMAMASAASASSACLSRQVGAAVYSLEGELIGIGCNDVPRFGGGLYADEDGEDDMRCAFWKGRICHNDHEKSRIVDEIVRSISLHITSGREQKVREAIGKSRVSELLEFSRAVHAEMEAIVAVARSGRAGIVGGELFTTTYPCHNCARHIVAAGITSVYYIEPYPKSLALTLHEDAISDSVNELGRRCVFLQFEGVAPKNMERLFRSKRERKKDGRYFAQSPVTAKPVAETPLDGFDTREDIIIATLPSASGRNGVKSEDVRPTFEPDAVAAVDQRKEDR